MADMEQTIETEVVVTGSCPEPLTSVIVRVAYEMLCNAVKHGMHMRLVGRITVRVRSNWDGSMTLLVSDDGWGPTGESEGEGLPIMRAIAQEQGGVVSINRVDNETVARLHLPIAL
jgi:two-component sensor histidine kinase